MPDAAAQPTPSARPGTAAPATDPATELDLLDRIDAYCDAVPRSSARTEAIGAFTLFVAAEGRPFYARPARGATGPYDVSAVTAVTRRQRELGVPEELEWLDALAPDLAAVAQAAGLVVHRHPLMVLDREPPAPAVAGVTVRLLGADDEALPAAQAAVSLGFRTAGTAVGDVGPRERDELAASREPASLDALRARLRQGLTVMAVAEGPDGPLAAGSLNPVGDVAEVAGVATLPSARRRGLGAAVTAALVAAARHRGVGLVFLSADSPEVARVYERVGFRGVGTACAAGPA